MRKPYAEWEVGEETYKLKLDTAGVVKLEEQLNTNLLNVVMSNGMPALSIMLKITHRAMQKFHHGIKIDKVYELFDEYCENGGSQSAFMTDVFIPIYQVSGFLSENMGEEMENRLKAAKEDI